MQSGRAGARSPSHRQSYELRSLEWNEEPGVCTQRELRACLRPRRWRCAPVVERAGLVVGDEVVLNAVDRRVAIVGVHIGGAYVEARVALWLVARHQARDVAWLPHLQGRRRGEWEPWPEERRLGLVLVAGQANGVPAQTQAGSPGCASRRGRPTASRRKQCTQWRRGCSAHHTHRSDTAATTTSARTDGCSSPRVAHAGNTALAREGPTLLEEKRSSALGYIPG